MSSTCRLGRADPSSTINPTMPDKPHGARSVDIASPERRARRPLPVPTAAEGSSGADEQRDLPSATFFQGSRYCFTEKSPPGNKSTISPLRGSRQLGDPSYNLSWRDNFGKLARRCPGADEPGAVWACSIGSI